jgi:ribosome maturation factor RimP
MGGELPGTGGPHGARVPFWEVLPLRGFLAEQMISRETLTELAEEVAGSQGLELVEIQLVPGRRQVLRVFVDGPHGIRVEECAAVSRQLMRRLEAIGPQAGDYVLEVSSPGMNRPIWSLEHYRRFQGERLRFELKEPRAGRLRFTGRILAVDGERVRLEIEGGEILELTAEEIHSARVQLDPWKGRR